MSKLSRSESEFDNKLLNDFMDKWEKEQEEKSWTKIEFGKEDRKEDAKEKPSEQYKSDEKGSVAKTQEDEKCDAMKRSNSISFESNRKRR